MKNNHIKDNIRFLRSYTGLSQQDFGILFKVSRDNIASYERGTEPKIEFISSIVNYFHIGYSDFIHTDISVLDIFQYQDSEICEQTESTHECSQTCSDTKSKEFVSKPDETIFNTKTPEYPVNQNDRIYDRKRKLQNIRSNDNLVDKSKKVNYEIPMAEQSVAADSAKLQYKILNVPYSKSTNKRIELQRVPLYDIEATAGLVGLFLDSSNQKPVDYISIPDLPPCDGAIHVRGDSMYPLLKSGDIVLYKQVYDVLHIVWGEMYLVSFSLDGDEYVAVKYIKKHESDRNLVILVSYNTHHSPMEIPIESIRALALVKASVRFNTMG